MADTLIMDGRDIHFPDITWENLVKALIFGAMFGVGAFFASEGISMAKKACRKKRRG